MNVEERCGMSDAQTLFDRIGGESAIESLIIDFYVRVMADTELAPFFRSSSLEKLHEMQREFFAMALGGPVAYTGRPLGHIHHGRGITTRHFSRFAGHLLATLEDMGISESEGAEVIERINTYVNEVVGVSY